MPNGLDAARDAVRTQLWPLPTVGVLVAVALGVLLPPLDGRVEANLPAWSSQYLFGGDADSARTVLDAVAGSLITVTSLTFSLTVLTLQLASGQFSPRLLRTFTRDLFVQGTLALFLATFTYALTVLRSVRTASSGQALLVPRLSVTIGFILAVASVLGLVLFLAHLAQQIRVETMLRNVHADATGTAERMLKRQDADQPELGTPAIPDSATALILTRSGFLTGIATEALCAAAVEADAVIVIDPHPGDAIIAGTPIGWVWSHTQEDLSAGGLKRVSKAVERGVSVGFERTATEDLGFGLRQLTDVANKALSPGINDPTTAAHALGHSAAFLCEIAGRDLGSQVVTDRDGIARVVVHRPDLADLLDLAISQPRRYGASDPTVLAQIYTLLRQLGWCCSPRSRDVIGDQRRRLDATVADQDFDATERASLAELSEQVAASTRGRWLPRAQ